MLKVFTPIIRPSLRSSFHINPIRTFKYALPLQLIYKRETKIKKVPESMDQQRKILKDAKTISDIEDIENIKSLANNKYYKRTPLLLKPFMREILLRPAGFIISIAILQQFLSIIPFLLLWYLYDKYNLSPPSLPENIVVKGLELMHNGLINWDESQGNKQQAELAGANAYATIRVLTPIIWISAILLAPFFDQFVIRSLTRIVKVRFNKLKNLYSNKKQE